MLTFLRKHQRIFFIIITFVIVVTFSFFGTYSTTSQMFKKTKDVAIGKAIDNSDMMLSDITALSRFLSSDHYSILSSGHKSTPNLLNDGVIYKDFFENKLVFPLVKKYFSFLQKDWKGRFSKIKRYSFYTHPRAPFISAKMCWKQMKPNLIDNIAHLQKCDGLTQDNFTYYSSIYLDQADVATELIKKILIYQQKQYPSLPFDQRVLGQDFSLFGFSSVDDWFGRNFVDMISQFIWNIALIAQEKDYVVTEDEAYFSLLANVKNAIDKYYHSEKEKIGMEKNVFSSQLRVLGLEEKKAIKLWQKVLLFRKVIKEATDNVVLDKLVFDAYEKFANEEVKISSYYLPSYMQFKDFNHFLLFQMYKKACQPFFSISENILPSLTSYYSVEQIEVKYPELIEKKFVLSVKSVHVDEIGLKIAEKKLWEWQLTDDNWKKIEEKFSSYKLSSYERRDERFGALEKLSKEQRKNIDRFSRQQMVLQNPGWIQKELNQKESFKQDVFIRSKNTILPFKKGIIHTDKLVQLLSIAPIREQKEMSAKEKEVQTQLNKYSDDQRSYYSFQIVEKDDVKQLISFKKALADTTIETILDTVLHEYYLNIRDQYQDKLKDDNDRWKCFFLIKEWIGALYFSDVLKNIEETYARSGGKITWTEKERPLHFYASQYLYDYVSEIKTQLEKHPETINDYVSREDNESLVNQWKLLQEEKTVARDGQDLEMYSLLFTSTTPVEWSQILKKVDCGLYFFHVEKRQVSKKKNAFEMNKVKNILGQERLQLLSQEWLSLIEDKQAINLPLLKEDDQ